MNIQPDLSGAMLCARYAFAPNFYHYCGPDTGGEFEEYLKAEMVDRGLIEHLTDFEVMYPYLAAIAQANGISDPLDPRVVEAYWVGNEMLEKVTERDVCVALMEKHKLQRKVSKKKMRWLLPKIDKKARLHHSFHVLNVFTRTGHHSVEHTVETMDECRIGWGRLLSSKFKVQSSRHSFCGNAQTAYSAVSQAGNCGGQAKQNQNNQIQIETQKLVYKNGKLMFEPAVREVIVPSDLMNKRLKPGDWVSVHWGFVCDQLTQAQVKQLRRYTEHHIKLANLTL